MQFSVVIPSYNTSRYLRETLGSLAQQDTRDFEVVVVDDQSADDSATVAVELIGEFGLQGEVIVRPPNASRGASSCRNIGLARSRGDWVAFLDSDDLFVPTKLTRLAQAIAHFGDQVRAIYHKSTLFDDATGEALGEVSGGGVIGEPHWMLDDLLVQNRHATCGIAIRRDLLGELGGFDLALNGVEDWWLVLRIAKRTPWVFLDETLARIRARSRSLMRNQPFVKYVEQHVALIDVARRSGELTAEQLGTLRASVMGPVTQHFSSKARARGGWTELLPGFARMVRAGYASEAVRIGYRHLRTSVLSTAVALARH